MALVEDKRTGGFSFTWSIHNFSYCVQKEAEFIDSPQFIVEALGSNYTWYLRLFPRGYGANGFISYYLRQTKSASVVNAVLSIRINNGLFKEIGEQTFNTNSISESGYMYFLSYEELIEPGAFLDNDILTLRCRIWRNETDLSTTINCYAYTEINITKLNYKWILKVFVDSNHDNRIIETKFNQSTKIQCFSSDIQCFEIHLLYGGTFGDDTIHFAIEKAENTKRMLLISMIHLIDVDGKVVHSVRGEYLFEESNKPKIFTFPFLSKHKLLSKENCYLKSGRLTLRCEFSASTEEVISKIERYEYEITDDVQFQSSSQVQLSDLSGSWKENMRRSYNEGKFSDVTIRTPNSQFPAHKIILCAQSEVFSAVFSAMFERDMKENRTGVVEIEDLEDDIVSKMLMFLYTHSLEDLDFSTASKLYFAADKYRMTALHRKCSKYLIHSLDTSNVCDVLALADTHQDQSLKSIAQDFIFAHDQQIINSENWKNLMEAKAHLTSETMQLMICKKFLCSLKP